MKLLKPRVPHEMQAAAEASEYRKERAIERLRSIAVEEGAFVEEDPFLRAMASLIDADRQVIQMRKRAR